MERHRVLGDRIWACNGCIQHELRIIIKIDRRVEKTTKNETSRHDKKQAMKKRRIVFPTAVEFRKYSSLQLNWRPKIYSCARIIQVES